MPTTRTIKTAGLSLMSFCLWTLIAPASLTTIKYTDNFESYTNNTPLTHGTYNDWHGTPAFSNMFTQSEGVVVVSNSSMASPAPPGSTNFARIPTDSSLSNRYAATESTNLWLQMDVAARHFDYTNSVVQPNCSAQFYINTNGNFVYYDGTDWQTATNDAVSGDSIASIDEGAWIHLDLRLDYENKKWQLDMRQLFWPSNSYVIAKDVNFATGAPAIFSGFEIYSGGNSTTYLDNVELYDTDAMPRIIINPPGLTNNVAIGNPAPTQSLDIISRGDGSINYQITTNNTSDSWLVLSSGSGSLTDNDTNRVYVSYYTNGLVPGRYENNFIVVSTNWGGSTQIVPVVLNLGALQVDPNILNNGAMQGFNPVSQTFEVENTGAGAFNYTVSSNAPWLHVSPSTGELGSASTNTHTVNYQSSGLNPGAYTGLITVASPDQGGMTQTVDVVLTVVSRPILTAQPLYIEQTVEKGANPTGMIFNVWNSGAEPRVRMEYITSNSVWWILPCLDGSSSGETNTIGVNFADMTALGTGDYSGTITLTGQDVGTGYTPVGSVIVTSRVDVLVKIRQLPAPGWITASSGTQTGRVDIAWETVPPFTGGTVTYEVWRGITRDFDPQFVMRIAGGLETPEYADDTVQPGILHYYWARAVNSYGGEGAISGYDSGYRGLSAPEGIWASTGEFPDKVRVRWVGSDGAQVYEIWRDGVLIQTTTTREYNDVAVAEGEQYKYKVRSARNGTMIQPSDYSREVAGYVLGRPLGLHASRGTQIGKVRLTWTGGLGATEYEIWRLNGAVYDRIGISSSAVYDDRNVSAGERYTYKVKGENASGETAFSETSEGYPGAQGVDLAVWQPVALPKNVLRGDITPMRVLSMRIGNMGGATLSGNDAKIRIEYSGYNRNTDTFHSMGGMTTELDLAPGQSRIFNPPRNTLRMPAAAGVYEIYVEIIPVWPSLLTDTNMINNIALVAGNVEVSATGGPGYMGFNDYSGDGISDMIMHVDGLWYGRTVDGYILGWAVPFGGPGFIPVYGLDLDGDNRADPVIFNNGIWRGMLSASGYAVGTLELGGPGFIPVPGDYTGNGRANAAVYSMDDGRWFVMNDAFQTVVHGEVFGAPGVVPVPGDYDGDGVWDMVVYHEQSGRWYGRGVDGELNMWGVNWGGSGYEPVMGDYTGDGIFDMAVYREETGSWHIQTSRGEEITRGFQWGGPGYTPVPGDYDGDGVWDLALYNRYTGNWRIRSLRRGLIIGETHWGLRDRLPVGQ